MSSTDRSLDPPRPLTRRERDVLDALLKPEFAGAEKLRAAVSDLRVHVQWACCPSVEFVPNLGSHWPVVNAWTNDFTRDVILFADDEGLPVCLELVNGEGDAEFPPPSTLTAAALPR